ncbi:MAG: DUF3592 domain-containing protein [Thermoanaerobaculia bacterium]
MIVKPVSSRRQGRSPRGCLGLFFLIFLAVGCAASYFTLWKPLTRYRAAQSWPERSCTILDSRVTENSDSDGSTYGVDIHYAYEMDGREYRSDRYDFLRYSSSGRSGKEAIVARYPPGSRAACYVNPEDPAEAVLTRDLSVRYLVGTIPLVFVAVGLGGLIWVMRSGALSGSTSGAGGSGGAGAPFGVAMTAGAVEPGGPVELRPTVTRKGMLFGLLFVALFWNGIVSVFVYQIWKSWREGRPEGCGALFISIFVLVGLALVFAVVRQFLILFTPRPVLTLSPAVLSTGGGGWLQWRLTGGAVGVRRLAVVLEGREEATYRRGTDTYTDRSVFVKVPILETADSYQIPGGTATFTVPAGTAPSFKADHNKIIWSLKVKCEIPGWPDSEEEYEVTVRSGGGN